MYVGLVALGIVAIGTIYYFLFARTTPSHVYQVTEKVVRELELMQQLENTTSRAVTYVPRNRMPRHVLQKAREVLLRVECSAR